MAEDNSERKDITDADLRFYITKEIAIFLEENREEITKRALEKIRKARKEASGDESQT